MSEQSTTQHRGSESSGDRNHDDCGWTVLFLFLFGPVLVQSVDLHRLLLVLLLHHAHCGLNAIGQYDRSTSRGREMHMRAYVPSREIWPEESQPSGNAATICPHPTSCQYPCPYREGSPERATTHLLIQVLADALVAHDLVRALQRANPSPISNAVRGARAHP